MTEYTDGAELLPVERESLSALMRLHRRHEHRAHNYPTRKRYRKALRMARRRAGIVAIYCYKTPRFYSSQPSSSYQEFVRMINREFCREAGLV